jgi:hypothetical protein
MTTYLDRLAAHARGVMPLLQPRPRSRYEPERDAVASPEAGPPTRPADAAPMLPDEDDAGAVPPRPAPTSREPRRTTGGGVRVPAVHDERPPARRPPADPARRSARVGSPDGVETGPEPVPDGRAGGDDAPRGGRRQPPPASPRTLRSATPRPDDPVPAASAPDTSAPVTPFADAPFAEPSATGPTATMPGISVTNIPVSNAPVADAPVASPSAAGRTTADPTAANPTAANPTAATPTDARTPGPTPVAAVAGGRGARSVARALRTVSDIDDPSPAPPRPATPRRSAGPPAVPLPSTDELVRQNVIPALAGAGLLTGGADVHVVPDPPVRARPGADLLHVERPSISRPVTDSGPPQVHVTIGRVTVMRAGYASPPPAPRPARGAVPDHEAYLARRRDPS